MVTINWTESKVSDPVTLADYIELTIALDGEHHSFEFIPDNFAEAIRDEPFSPEAADFLDWDDADDAKKYYESAVSLIERRARWFGDLYPFTGEGNVVRFTPASDRGSWSPYIFLLACSHHDLIKRKGLHLDRDFEDVCKEAIAALFSESADVFSFSQYSDDRRQMGHSARVAVHRLAEKLNSKVIVEDENIPTSSNEFGIDIAVIDALGDTLARPFFTFAQCTVSGDPGQWQRKKDEAQSEIGGINEYIHIGMRHSNLFFVPHLPRIRADKWSVWSHRISNCVFCDRYRICKALQRLSDSNRTELVQATNQIIGKFMASDGKKLSTDNLARYAVDVE